jgi:haloacetate dehalogenase
MFDGFKHVQIQTTDPQVAINLRYSGQGPGLLLLHGNPLTHVTWHKIAERLAQDFTLVVSDLRGYGDSSKPRGLPDHSNYTFRRMALDQVEIMDQLGFQEFFLAGHDRGARTAFRMALDHPDRIRKFASIEIVPTHHVWFYGLDVTYRMGGG